MSVAEQDGVQQSVQQFGANCCTTTGVPMAEGSGDTGDLWQEAVDAVLRALIEQSELSAKATLDLAEAYAWLRSTQQPHGGR